MKATSYAEMIGAPSKDFADETKECENMLVGNFIGRRLPYMFVKTTLMKLWDLKGDLEMTTKGRFLFFFQFSCDEDRQGVLDMGQQHIASRIFFIRAWRPFIEFEPIEMKTIPIWVILHELPDQFWNADGISRIVSALGVPLFLDKASEDKRKGRSFVRICVEMSVDCAFPKEISIEMDESYTIEIPVEYNWIPVKCSHCCVFGSNEEAPGDPSDQVGKTKGVGEETSNLSKRALKRARRKGFKEDQEAKKIVDALPPSKHKYNLGEVDYCTMKKDALA
ncbi:hypothetical protein GIB67_033285, partial [Kingdonia uniflora]